MIVQEARGAECHTRNLRQDLHTALSMHRQHVCTAAHHVRLSCCDHISKVLISFSETHAASHNTHLPTRHHKRSTAAAHCMLGGGVSSCQAASGSDHPRGSTPVSLWIARSAFSMNPASSTVLHQPLTMQ